MATVTISMRLSQEEATRLERLAREMDMERPTFLRRALKRGTEDLLFEHACKAYREGRATLSRAAEMAGVGLREMILRMQQAGLELHYGVEDLEADLAR